MAALDKQDLSEVGSGFFCLSTIGRYTRNTVHACEARKLPKQGFSGVCEDVPASFHYAVARKKRLRLFSEELLRLPLCGKMPKACREDLRLRSAIFFGKKKAAGIFTIPRHSEPLFEAKNSEFSCEMKF